MHTATLQPRLLQKSQVFILGNQVSQSMSARCCHVDNNDDYTHVNDEDNNDDWNHADDDGNKMTIPMLMKMITT